MSEPYRNPAPKEIESLPPSAVRWMAGLVLWLAVPWWIILGHSSTGILVFAVCVVFSVVAFGAAVICLMWTRRVHWRRRGRRGPETGAPRRLRISTGSLPLDEATVQLLTIPGALALGFTAIALAYAAVRATS